MKIITFLFALLLTTAAHATCPTGTWTWCENFDSYTSNASLPTNPWYSYDNTSAPYNAFTSTSEYIDSPNSLISGENGYETVTVRDFPSSSVGTFDLWMYPGDPSCYNCGWVSWLGAYKISEEQGYMGFRYGYLSPGNPPPAGTVAFTALDANGIQRGEFNVTCCTWHHMVFQWKIDPSAGYMNVSIDGSSVLAYSGATCSSCDPNISSGQLDAFEIYSEGVGGNPTCQLYLDDIAVLATNNPLGGPMTIQIQ